MNIMGWKVNPKVTAEAVAAAVERRRGTLDDPGFCIGCGLEALGVDPDARWAECEACGEPRVFGCEELLAEMEVAGAAAQIEARWPWGYSGGESEP